MSARRSAAGLALRCRLARGLRASAPAAKPLLPIIARGHLEALGAVLRWPALEIISPHRGRSQRGAESDRHGRNYQLMHERPSPMVVYASPVVA